MKCFRVRGDMLVEPFHNWKRLDGKAYVPVGGLRLSFITVDEGLADLTLPAGTIERASFVLKDRQSIVLTTEVEPENGALVVIPAAGYEFPPALLDGLVCPLEQNVARLILMNPGDKVKVFPRCKTLAECRKGVFFELAYQGGEVTFRPA